MQTKVEKFGNYKRTLFRGKDGRWYVRECSCTSRKVCAGCGDYTDCGVMPGGAGVTLAFVFIAVLFFILVYSLLFFERIIPIK